MVEFAQPFGNFLQQATGGTGVRALSQEPLNQIQRDAISSLGLGSRTGLQNQGRSFLDDISGAINQSQNFLGGAGGNLAQGTQQLQPGQFAQGISRFSNPFDEQVIQQSIADIQKQGERLRPNITSAFSQAGGLGSTREGVENSLLSESILDQIGRTTSGLRQQGFNDASSRFLGNRESELGRFLQAAGLGGGLSGAALGQAGAAGQGVQGALGLEKQRLGTAAAALGAGDVVQNQNQRMLDALFGATNDAFQSPFNQTNFLQNILSGVPIGQSNRTKSGGGLSGAIGGALGGGLTGAGVGQRIQ